MMHQSAVSPEVLSRLLHSSGALPAGTVTAIDIDREVETPVSRLAFVTATYSSDSPPGLPHQLVVKSPIVSSILPDAGARELEFYRRLAPTIGSPPLARCLATVDAGNGAPETLVLQDLRATHDHPAWPLPPSRVQSERAVETLAHVHAEWWEAYSLGRTFGSLHSTESLTEMVQGIATHLPAFLDARGDAITADSRQILETVFSSSLKPWMRLVEFRALTVTHGDAHSWNFLFPRSGEGPAVLIDWQLWHIDVGARDLAFMMALHWYPGRRRELEVPLLRLYHEVLLGRGVKGYSFDDLMLDYRLSVVRNLTFPIVLWSRGMNPEAWFHRLECALAAYRDLDCAELL
ncbi:MAG: aminoglycoside phosphotransferase family protein [Gemmatimonadales bacterium]